MSACFYLEGDPRQLKERNGDVRQPGRKASRRYVDEQIDSMVHGAIPVGDPTRLQRVSLGVVPCEVRGAAGVFIYEWLKAVPGDINSPAFFLFRGPAVGESLRRPARPWFLP